MFRVPGDADVVSALKTQCDNWVAPSDEDAVSDPNIIASLVKLWYRELHEPLIPREHYGRCVEAYSSPDEAVKIVSLLPHLNRLVLTYLVRFLQVRRFSYFLPSLCRFQRLWSFVRIHVDVVRFCN